MSNTAKTTESTKQAAEITEITPPHANYGNRNALVHGVYESAEDIPKGTEGPDWAGLVQEFEENMARWRELDERFADSMALFKEEIRQIRAVLAKLPPETVIEGRIVQLFERLVEEWKSMLASLAEKVLKDAQLLRQISQIFGHKASEANHSESSRYLERSESVAQAAALVEKRAFQMMERLSALDEEDAKIASTSAIPNLN
jgi:hypothetical protein